jgi:hypothetical protein
MHISKDKLDLIIAALEIIGGFLVSFLGVRLLDQLGPGVCFNCACQVLTSFLVLLGQLDSSCQFRETILITMIIAIVLAVIGMFFDKLVVILMLQFLGDFIFKQVIFLGGIYLTLGIKVSIIVAILLFGVIFGCRLDFSNRAIKTALLCAIVGSIDIFYGATFINKRIFKFKSKRDYIMILIGIGILALVGFLIQTCYFIKRAKGGNGKKIPKIQL